MSLGIDEAPRHGGEDRRRADHVEGMSHGRHEVEAAPAGDLVVEPRRFECGHEPIGEAVHDRERAADPSGEDLG